VLVHIYVTHDPTVALAGGYYATAISSLLVKT